MRQHSSAIRQGEYKERSDAVVDYAGRGLGSERGTHESEAEWGQARLQGRRATRSELSERNIVYISRAISE